MIRKCEICGELFDITKEDIIFDVFAEYTLQCEKKQDGKIHAKYRLDTNWFKRRLYGVKCPACGAWKVLNIATGKLVEFNGAPVDFVTIERDDMEYKYGMRLRGFSPGCQPMNGFVRREDDITGTYHDIIVYNRPLTAEERKQYELDDMTEAEK